MSAPENLKSIYNAGCKCFTHFWIGVIVTMVLLSLLVYTYVSFSDKMHRKNLEIAELQLKVDSIDEVVEQRHELYAITQAQDELIQTLTAGISQCKVEDENESVGVTSTAKERIYVFKDRVVKVGPSPSTVGRATSRDIQRINRIWKQKD